ncbi:Cysteine proteinase inhibitor 5 [Acorus gramineus]|uniref:Cysteine proteinase inhibitor 5 n=1 Tax=Acorus gramineus TaxID=55184 RepID=A0AAV9BAB1_ACOGR|nr:Cysteine proteinase inhibitor 5 [Acorus gramineus]
MRFQTSPLLLLLLSFLLFNIATAIVGGWTPINDVNDPHVRDIGRYAVDRHERLTGENLLFNDILSGETQVVEGVNYRLVISANEVVGAPSSAKKYEAVVWEKAWEGFRNLTSFKPINNA